jgi:hypothetical protein
MTSGRDPTPAQGLLPAVSLLYSRRNMAIKGAGGTPGGVGAFFVGLLMAVAGAYMVTSQVTVSSGFWGFFGYDSFGLTLLPLLFGVGLLFFNGRSPWGWLLTAAGCVIIFAGILMNLRIYFQPTSLFNTLVMLVLLVGGLGLVARSLRPYS